jgi:putative membrane-bound dehydrogenase-like protein
VIETIDYPNNLQAGNLGHDRIKVCEDTDGDGRADKFTVFADELNIPTSLVFAKGGIVVTQPPRLLFLKDTDGDDRADVREVIMEGWGIGDTHAQANNLHWGYDNWLYGCVGYSGFNGTVGGREMRDSRRTDRRWNSCTNFPTTHGDKVPTRLETNSAARPTGLRFFTAACLPPSRLPDSA